MDMKDENETDVNQFGWWPEIAAAIGVGLLILILIACARGTI